MEIVKKNFLARSNMDCFALFGVSIFLVYVLFGNEINHETQFYLTLVFFALFYLMYKESFQQESLYLPSHTNPRQRAKVNDHRPWFWN